MDLFKKKKYVPLPAFLKAGKGPAVPDGLWVKCPACGKTVYKQDLGETRICPQCGGYFRMNAWRRIRQIVDAGTFLERDAGLIAQNPMNYPGYDEKIAALSEKTKNNDAVVCGICKIGGEVCALGVMDGQFIMGSMGSVVGEKLARLFETATEKRLPAVIFTVSGGARMQEGILSLMQMAKVSAACARHSEAGLLYVTVLTDPTTGGVTASFAMLGDVILAEPGAVVGFAGRRVIEQTIKQTLPAAFQSAEFVQEHGFIDKIVPREHLRDTLIAILKLHRRGDDNHARRV